MNSFSSNNKIIILTPEFEMVSELCRTKSFWGDKMIGNEVYCKYRFLQRSVIVEMSKVKIICLRCSTNMCAFVGKPWFW